MTFTITDPESERDEQYAATLAEHLEAFYQQHKGRRLSALHVIAIDEHGIARMATNATHDRAAQLHMLLCRTAASLLSAIHIAPLDDTGEPVRPEADQPPDQLN